MSPKSHLHGSIVGIAWMIAAMIVIPLMDGTAKYLVQRYPPMEVIWTRYFFHLVFMLPVALWRFGWCGMKTPNITLQLVRGGLMVASTVFFVNAVRTLPFADTLALVFIAPLIVTALSPWALDEKVGTGRWIAVVVGFAGACIIIRPGFGSFDWGTVLAICAGTAYALYLIATRKLAGSAPPLVTLTYTALMGGTLCGLAMPGQWISPTIVDLGHMALMGAISAGGHFLIIKAFDRSPASVLAPLVYLQIATATIFGYLVFGDFPDVVTWMGIAVVVGSGLYISLAERRT